MNYGCWLLRFHEFKHPEALAEQSYSRQEPGR
jgi:hypothetical protein